MAALVVVLPTPPLPEVMTRIFAKMTFLTDLELILGAHEAQLRVFTLTCLDHHRWLNASVGGSLRMVEQYLLKGGYLQAVPFEINLYRLLPLLTT